MAGFDVFSEAIVVRPEHRAAKAAWNAGALMLWLGAAIDMASRVSATTVPTMVLVSASTIWLMPFFFVSANLVWILCGQQVVQIKNGHLECFYRLGTFVLGRKRIYRVTEVGDVRREIKSYHAKGKTFTRSDITFYLGRSGSREILFKYISDKQADNLLAGALKPFARQPG